MAAVDVIGRIYSGASSFGRDVFHYIVTGTLFVVVCSIPFWERCGDFWPSSLSEAVVESTGLQIVLLFVAAIVMFCTGHALLSVGFCIRKYVWTKVLFCSVHVANYEEAIRRVKNLGGDQAWRSEDRDVHLDAEMRVFVKRPDIHTTFVERYNSLWHLRLGLAASLLLSGAISAVVGCLWCRHLLPVSFTVGVVAILSGLLLMRQHLVTNTSFLNRVLAAYQIVQQEAEKPETQS